MPPKSFGRILEVIVVCAVIIFLFNTLSDYAHGAIDFAPCMACENGG